MPEGAANVTVNRSDVVIRQAERSDCRRMLDLIHELAVYEHAAEHVTVTLDEMEACGFGPVPLWGAYVAEWRSPDGPLVIGMALYYVRYSTWKGAMLYLEDFVVSAAYRGGGIGQALFDRVVQHAKEKQFHGMAWQALDWNTSAINFYRKRHASVDPGWVNCTIFFNDAKKDESA